MITFKQAQEIITGFAKSFGTESLALEQVLGRILAEPIVADRDYPPFNRATMDGYAMQLEDVKKGTREFTVTQTIFAGQVADTGLQVGQCFKIMTGASVPQTADLIIRREDIMELGATIQIQPGDYRAFQNIARQGEDVKAGERIISPSIYCTPAVVSVLAALGRHHVLVEKRPRVAVFTTGNEIVPVREPVTPVQIRNSNQYLLTSLLQKWGIEPFLNEHIRDDKKDLFLKLQEGLAGDFVVISGGVSAGDADYVPEILESLGVRKLFHKVSIKPGKPIWCGYVPGGAMVFALPGNPFSSLITFILFVDTYLSHCLGLGGQAMLSLPMACERSKRSDLDEFFPVAIQGQPLSALPLSFNGSGDILASLLADGIAHHPAALSLLAPGSQVLINRFKN